MNDTFISDAHDYLHGHMDAVRRGAFEAELERSAEAATALKDYADGLARYAIESAPPETLPPHEQMRTVKALTQVAASRRRRPSWGWPLLMVTAAAVLLLMANLIDFPRPVTLRSRVTQERGRPTRPSEGVHVADAAARGGSGSDAQGSNDRSGATAAESTAGASARRAFNPEMDQLLKNVADLQRANRQLRAENEALLSRMATRTLVEKELERLSTMELVDAQRYVSGQRRGLVNIGREILTEPGVVVPPEGTPGPVDASTVAQPYAWSVFDEKEHRGYLNVYNLPSPPPEQMLQVWVRAGEGAQYQPVAEVPALPHGRGAVQYTLPAENGPPAEVLITQEPRGTTPTVPTGPVVVKGP